MLKKPPMVPNLKIPVKEPTNKLKQMITFKSCLQFREAMHDFHNAFEIDVDGKIWAKLCYMPRGNRCMRPEESVLVYGDFTDNPWRDFIPCQYDYNKGVFYLRTQVKIGS